MMDGSLRIMVGDDRLLIIGGQQPAEFAPPHPVGFRAQQGEIRFS